MLWMATTSVVLAVGQWDLSTSRLPENLLVEVRLRVLTWSLGFGPLQGMALVGVLIFLWRRFWSHVPFPTEPGHWILIICGAGVIVNLASHVPYLLAVRGNESFVPDWAARLPRYAIGGCAILLAVMGAYSERSSRIWRLSILALGLSGAMAIVHSVAIYWPFTRQFPGGNVWQNLLRFGFSLPGLLALVAAFLDWRRKQHRDFLHWCGVAFVVLSPTVEWLRTFLHP